MALCAFRYSHSCVSLRLFMHLGAHLANSPCIAFGCPSCQLPLPCIAFGHPSCELALPYIWAPNLGEAVLKTLPPSQNWFLSILQLVFFPSAPFVWSFSLRLFVRFVTTIRAFRYGSSCVWSTISLTGLALHLGAPLANSPCLALGRPTLAKLLVRFVTALVRLGAHVAKLPCVAFGCPSCELSLRCVRAPNLGEAVLKNIPPIQNRFLSVLQLVFFPSSPLCGRFCYGSSCISLRPFVHFVMALRAFGRPSCQLVLHFIWVPILPTGLAFRLGAHIANWSCIS
jgi:hypothetical protein